MIIESGIVLLFENVVKKRRLFINAKNLKNLMDLTKKDNKGDIVICVGSLIEKRHSNCYQLSY
ncbi:Uncharacterised protein [Bacillus freudenreichii]|nr:Uncharacterised protein [Bacillus freudenreichii]